MENGRGGCGGFPFQACFTEISGMQPSTREHSFANISVTAVAFLNEREPLLINSGLLWWERMVSQRKEKEGLVKEKHLMISQSLLLYKHQRKIIPQMRGKDLDSSRNKYSAGRKDNYSKVLEKKGGRKALADLTNSTKSSSVAESELRQSTEKGHGHELFSQGNDVPVHLGASPHALELSMKSKPESPTKHYVQVEELPELIFYDQEASGQFCFHVTHFYGLKEHMLATCLIDALSMPGDSDDARHLLNWRKGGPRTASNSGNFSLVATEIRLDDLDELNNMATFDNFEFSPFDEPFA
ncbi:hypothetical protein H5410_002439 [Solanum commersonii]|uniref:Uncharacterized protein n=1 Tax=Solanum commersonii TaxID=4109 RepID=A0A9J6B2B4_SOLCO|nr:hypothetical protein H5410_002439 [Solanum commersonii]